MKRPVFTLLAFALAVGVGYWVFHQYLSLDSLIEQERRLRTWVAEYPRLAVMIGFLIYVGASLVPGTFGKAIVYGWLFGFWTALLVVNFALTAAAVLAFLATRHLFQAAAHAKLGPLIGRVDRALLRDGPLYLVTVRLLSLPYSLINYAAGATAVNMRTFWWTTQLGILPGNVVFVLAGAQLPSLQQLTREGIWSLINFPLLVGLSVAALVPIAIREAARRWLVAP